MNEKLKDFMVRMSTLCYSNFKDESADELSHFINDEYKPDSRTRGTDIVDVEVIRLEDKGYTHVAIVRDEDVLIAFKGTDSIENIMHDKDMVDKEVSEIFIIALMHVRRLMRKYMNKKFIFTGHSLGGSIAQFMGYIIPKSKAYTFNAFGVEIKDVYKPENFIQHITNVLNLNLYDFIDSKILIKLIMDKFFIKMDGRLSPTFSVSPIGEFSFFEESIKEGVHDCIKNTLDLQGAKYPVQRIDDTTLLIPVYENSSSSVFPNLKITVGTMFKDDSIDTRKMEETSRGLNSKGFIGKEDLATLIFEFLYMIRIYGGTKIFLEAFPENDTTKTRIENYVIHGDIVGNFRKHIGSVIYLDANPIMDVNKHTIANFEGYFI
ncbi:MAG: lipase family protein [Peptostreptococcaceae bacterium]